MVLGSLQTISTLCTVPEYEFQSKCLCELISFNLVLAGTMLCYGMKRSVALRN